MKSMIAMVLIAAGCVVGSGAAFASSRSEFMVPRSEAPSVWARDHGMSGDRNLTFMQVPTARGLRWEGTYEYPGFR